MREILISGDSPLLTPAEVAAAFRVDVKTVTRWAVAGRLRAVRTPGVKGPGHRRYYRAEVEALLAGDTPNGGQR
jgi:excisionase family DNA binding protein